MRAGHEGETHILGPPGACRAPACPLLGLPRGLWTFGRIGAKPRAGRAPSAYCLMPLSKITRHFGLSCIRFTFMQAVTLASSGTASLHRVVASL